MSPRADYAAEGKAARRASALFGDHPRLWCRVAADEDGEGGRLVGYAGISVVKNEPYKLAGDVWGIGFKTADTIAQAMGIPHDSPARVKAGVQFTLSEASGDGHCYLPEGELIDPAL